MPHQVTHHSRKTRRTQRVRSQTRGTPERPRLTVSRSHRHISAQIIDDQQSTTLLAYSSHIHTGTKTLKTQQAQDVGQQIAKLALKKNVKQVVFDRGPFRYHGRVKALAEAARQAGLKF